MNVTEKRKRRIIWLILDAAGYEIASRCLDTGVCPSLAAIRSEGYLGPSRPPEPNCETPPALRALFAGSEPPESGIWGFRMPCYEGRLERSVSGFSVRPRGAAAIWDELERRGEGYTLFNAAFRQDSVWGNGYSHFDLVLDAYRNYDFQKAWTRLEQGRGKLSCCRVRLRAEREGDSVNVRRGCRSLAALSAGGIRPLRLSRTSSALLYRANDRLFLFSSSIPHVRLGRKVRDRIGLPGQAACPSSLVPGRIFHGGLFRFAREKGGLSPEEEMRVSEVVTEQTAELAISAIRSLPSRLFIIYFPLIDELCHVYLDEIEAGWPQGRGADLLRRCFGLLDSCIGRIMELADDNTLLAVSSDHGQIPFRRALHFNDLLAEAGLVRSRRAGYDLRRSVCYYHPSNCGQVVVNWRRARKAGLSRDRIIAAVLQCLEQANSALGAGIAFRIGGESDPYLLFLYPQSDTRLTGRYDPDAEVMDTTLKGGHHLSPLCPTPLIQALLGLWSPAGLSRGLDTPPERNTELKDFLLRYLFELRV